jgi:hypothetical protein
MLDRVARLTGWLNVGDAQPHLYVAPKTHRVSTLDKKVTHHCLLPKMAQPTISSSLIKPVTDTPSVPKCKNVRRLSQKLTSSKFDQVYTKNMDIYNIKWTF